MSTTSAVSRWLKISLRGRSSENGEACKTEEDALDGDVGGGIMQSVHVDALAGVRLDGLLQTVPRRNDVARLESLQLDGGNVSCDGKVANLAVNHARHRVDLVDHDGNILAAARWISND